MKTLNYILFCGLVLGALGMAKAPSIPSASISYNQQITNFVNNMIQNCLSDCKFSNIDQDCNKTCTDESVFFAGEYHDRIINKYGNVL